MRPYKVDVPVRVQVWNRPDCQRKQFEVLKEAAPSILFLISDGGRTEEEMKKIRESRAIMEEIDWDCAVYKLYFEENQGMYTVGMKTREFIWSRVDRCIFLEDDYVPAVSFFRFCAELLEKYKDDERIHMITGNNPFEAYPDAEPYDYFFSETGWSIWGTACWKRTADEYIFPLPYENDEYAKKCLRDNLPSFWRKKMEGYCKQELVDNHVPGSEYFHGINSALYHRLSIIPTKNMIMNIGSVGTHVNCDKDDDIFKHFYVKTHEIDFPIKHPPYMIDDKAYGEKYMEYLGLFGEKNRQYYKQRIKHIMHIFGNRKRLNKAVKRKIMRLVHPVKATIEK